MAFRLQIIKNNFSTEILMEGLKKYYSILCSNLQTKINFLMGVEYSLYQNIFTNTS
jgi:hypothetical protein